MCNLIVQYNDVFFDRLKKVAFEFRAVSIVIIIKIIK